MTAGAVGLVGSGRPGSHLRIARVTAQARDCRFVCPGEVGTGMREADWRPRHRGVATVTLDRCHEVRGGLARGAGSVVTG